MSAVCILTPLVIAAWPAFSAAVAAAASSLGYQVVSGLKEEMASTASAPSTSVQLEIARSEVVTGQLGRDQHITVTRGGITVTFSRDARGKASLCVTGEGQSREELKASGEELSETVVQQYVYQKLMDEMSTRGFVVVDQEINDDRSIRLKVRHWEN
jgi:hypothetical protein